MFSIRYSASRLIPLMLKDFNIYRIQPCSFKYCLANGRQKCSILPHAILRQKRFKYSKSNKIKDDSSDDEDEFGDDADEGSKVINATVSSLRVDTIVKVGLGLARNKVEALFYENKLRLNGRKISKKSHQINTGDEIDIIIGASSINPTSIEISRLVLVSAKTDEENIKIRLKRFKSLLVENYKTDV